MTTYRDRLTRRATERILDHRGDPTDPLARLVDAAAAAPSSDAPGEELAVSLFREARGLGPVPASGRPAALTRLSRRLAALPAAALAAGVLVLGGGGLALAATQGALHVPFTGHDDRSDRAPAAPSGTNPGLSHTAGDPSAEGSGVPGAGATHLPSATPSPSLAGLCRAYQAGAVPRKASNPAFAALSSAAGGAAGVGSYCTSLVGAPSKPAHPTQAARPTVPPTPDHATTPPVPRPTQAVSPTTPPKPAQAVGPTTPPKPTRAAH
jgi:hypothetical protein